MLTRYAQHDVVWVDLVSPTPGELKKLMQEFDLHPTIVEELTSPSIKPKVERIDNCIYLALHFPSARARGRAEQEIDFVLGKHYLITVRYDHLDPLHMFAKSFEVGTVLGTTTNQHGGHLFAAMAKSLYRSLVAECDALRIKLDDIEDLIFKGREREMVARISDVGRVIHDFRRTLVNHQEILQSLEAPGERMFGAAFPYHMRAVMAEEARIRHTLEHLREWLHELRENNNSLLSFKQNDVMKTLTVLAFVFLPLSFIAGLFGMNTLNNPVIGSTYDFWILCGIMASVAAGCCIYFKTKNWL
jgi:magnesium transporter